MKRVIRKVEFCQFNTGRIVHTNSLNGLGFAFELSPKSLEFIHNAEGNAYVFLEEGKMNVFLLALYNSETGELAILKDGSRKEEIKKDFAKCLFDIVKQFAPYMLEK